MATSAEPISAGDKARLLGLMADYLQEMDAIIGSPQPTRAYPNLDAYWSEPGARWPYWLRSGGAEAGFALVRRLPAIDRFEIAEFFVARRYRRRGIGLAAARAVIARHPGRWRITQREANHGAIAFWHRVLDGFVRYDETATTTDAARREQRFDFV